MLTILLFIMTVSTTGISFPPMEALQEKIINEEKTLVNEIKLVINAEYKLPVLFNEVNEMLQRQSNTLSPSVINKVLYVLNCANEYHVEHKNILTIIDYSLPSSEKRLWVFDLKEKKLLFHTYVSHGIKSGALISNYFSNKFNSKASSIGVYKTEKAYYGREGISLRLEGLERSFNDNASNRSVVMHGGWYMAEEFIKKYGRAGRSWGCPAIPKNLSASIINTIKDNSLFVIYYPSDDWFVKSKFFHCEKTRATPANGNLQTAVKSSGAIEDSRENILLTGLSGKYNSEGNEAILVIDADNYERIFHNKAPLERMLRRQINNVEYIALSTTELGHIAITHEGTVDNSYQEALNKLYFVVPVLKMVRGYYETEMKIVNLGTIKEVRLNWNTSKNSNQSKNYTVYFNSNSSINLRTTNRFIRWLGL